MCWCLVNFGVKQTWEMVWCFLEKVFQGGERGGGGGWSLPYSTSVSQLKVPTFRRDAAFGRERKVITIVPSRTTPETAGHRWPSSGSTFGAAAAGRLIFSPSSWRTACATFRWHPSSRPRTRRT
uniref:(northern house mosquito) hypothetical protein n=1 Tax=Culex pipiens TaxID=7175 RepID=A0A8D8MQF6_CULPI